MIKNKKKKKPRRTKLLKDIEHLCSELCKVGAGGLCEICGKVGTQAHHHFSKKAFPHLRYELKNLVWTCFFCHIIKIHRQGQYELSRQRLVSRLGEEGFIQLRDSAYIVYTEDKTLKYNTLPIKQLDELYKELQELLIVAP